jgi:hypothetical protein
MATQPLTDEKCREALEAFENNDNSVTKAAAALGIPRTTLDTRIREARHRGLVTTGFKPVTLPDEHVSTEDLIARRKKQFEKKRKYEDAAKLIRVQVTIDGPIGILHFGDPHVDDDGTDIEKLEHDIDIVKKTEGMFGANVGDTTNNWVGRLARLYAQQSTTAAEAWQLAEWFLTQFRWLYILAGNHDLWSGSGDPIKWIAGQTNSMYKSSEARMALHFPNNTSVRINARHDFSGTSIYNPAHGPMKALTWGVRDHIATCGHKHISGYGVMKDPDSGITMHAIQIGSFKIFDRFAKEKGFRDQSLGPSVVTVIDPYLSLTSPDLVKVFWDSAEGAEYLKFKRKQWKGRKS